MGITETESSHQGKDGPWLALLPTCSLNCSPDALEVFLLLSLFPFMHGTNLIQALAPDVIPNLVVNLAPDLIPNLVPDLVTDLGPDSVPNLVPNLAAI